MAPAAPVRKVVRFENFEVDLLAGQLRKGRVKLKLADQSFEALAILLEHAGEVVTREHLRRRLWPQDVFVDFDNNLNTVIARLREALGDSAEHPRFIETLPKHGYRFIANVFKAAPTTLPRPAPRARMVVLPFVNLSGDPAQEYFSDAVTEEIISELAAMAPGQLAVIARTTAMHYKATRKDVAQIGSELGVNYVLEGSVRRASDRISVSAQLIQAADQMHLLARKYDGELRDLFRIERMVTQAIAKHFGVGDRRSSREPTTDLQAYDLYIQGRYHFAKASPDGLCKAKQYFEGAIARDPEFALAYDGIAEIYWYIGFFGFARPKDVLSTGIYHALRALEIDNTLAETHALLAQYRKLLDYDWSEVRRELARALELNPASPSVRLSYAVNGLMPHGRMEQAVTELQIALESDPLSMPTRIWLALMLLLWRHYDLAAEQALTLLERDPAFHWAHLVLGVAHREMRNFDESIAAHRRAADLSGDSPLMLGWLGLALGQSGAHAEARALLDRLRAMASKTYVPPSSFAWIHFGLGETNSAFECCNQAIEARDDMMMAIKSYAFLDPFRAHPCYLALLRKMNLEP
ncbi:MAG TPA: winged helix-turn-helix domain-containing protein [Bryobacteraceae bacterium]|nr:winged helix-turn-helix domain-containing protein [Bryobacteraceae bacterium]